MFQFLPPRRPFWLAGQLLSVLLLAACALPGRAQSILEHWPLTSNYSATTAPGIVTPPSAPTFANLVMTASGDAIGYSALGQAFAPNPDGTGWTSSSSPLLTRYQEFPITIATGYQARIDSLYLKTGVNNTSNGKLAIAYSTDGFATSTFIVGSISGSTITGVGVNNVRNLTGSNSTYTDIAVAVNGTGGVALAAGGQLAFRLYYATGSTSSRPAELKALSIRGQTITVNSFTATAASVSFTTPNNATGHSYALNTTPAGGSATLVSAPTSANSYVATYSISGLSPSTAYSVTVVGTNPPANTLTTTITSPSFTTSSSAPAACNAVTDLSVGNISSTTAIASFTAVSGATGYTVTTSPATSTYNITGTTANLTGLTAGTAYTVSVVTNCAAGATSSAATATFSTSTAPPTITSTVLERWLLTANNQPDAPAAGVTASTPTFAALQLSNTGTIPNYSTSHGQTFAPNATGDGWAASASQNLNTYQEFTVVAASGYTLRVDSLIFSSAINNSSNGRIGVLYSIDGFASSHPVTGGILPNGGNSTPTPQPAGATGAFTLVAADQTLLPNRASAGFTGNEVYRLALNAATGVTVAAGQTLRIRLYYSVSGTSSVRPAMLKVVAAKGESTLTGIPTCDPATNLAVSNVGPATATMTFTAASGATGYTVTTLPATSTYNVTGTTVNLTGLTAGTAYIVNVVTNCAASTTSTTATASFTTLAPSVVLQQWPLTAGSQDDAAARSTSVMASTAALQNLTLSNGTMVSSIPDYSANGQAFGPSTNGDGGGWNGTPSATLFTEFVVTAKNGNSLRIDSLLFATAFYNTSNGRLSVAYSLDDFATAGTYILGTASAPVTVNNQNVGYSQYRLALNGPSGVTRTASQVLTFRFFYAAGTSSAGRYALLRNVQVKGNGVAAPLPVTLTAFDARRQGSDALLTWTTATEQNSRGFDVQVSADGRNYRTLGFVDSESANSTTAHRYQFLDREAGKRGLRYYRLRQLDLDGREATFAPRAVQFEGEASLSAAPNPFRHELKLLLQTTQPAQTTLRLTDALGRTVLAQPLTLGAGATNVTLPSLSYLPGGLYVLHFNLNGQTQRVKLVKE